MLITFWLLEHISKFTVGQTGNNNHTKNSYSNGVFIYYAEKLSSNCKVSVTMHLSTDYCISVQSEISNGK